MEKYNFDKRERKASTKDAKREKGHETQKIGSERRQ
jgi:hypothetical protein